MRSFLDRGPYKVGAKHHPETRKLIYYVVSVEPVPDCLPLIAGDVIQNLMSALDHLAYQIVSNDTADNPPAPRRIYFPIADDAAKYETKKRERKEGATQATFDALDGIKSYKGGNDLLWVLHQLNNIEKHRLLLTVGSQAGGMNLGQWIAGHLAGTFPADAVAAFESMNVFIIPQTKGFLSRQVSSCTSVPWMRSRIHDSSFASTSLSASPVSLMASRYWMQ